MIKSGGVAIVSAGVLFGASLLLPPLFTVEYQSAQSLQQSPEEIVAETVAHTSTQLSTFDARPVVQHVPLPEQVKAIYMTACVVGTPSFRQRLIDLMVETEINAVVIDIKDYSGTISYPTKLEAWQPAWEAAQCGARDMEEFIDGLHNIGIFVIGRMTVFQDPFYAPRRPDLAVQKIDGTIWQDGKGLHFIDVGSRDYWDHIIALSVEAYNLGFDEINYDYVRYPSDGPMDNIAFPQSMAGPHGADKQANLEAFFSYLHEAMTDESRFAAYHHTQTGRATSTPYLSADLFGMTTTNYDDLSIGQVIERAAPYFDFIAPMVYPSHYPNSFLGLGNPNDHPYEVVYHAMKRGVERMESPTTPVQGFLHEPEFVTNASGTKMSTGKYVKPVYDASRLRTWIQDFDYGGDYDAADVRAQIQASYDAGVMDWMIWAPSNIYTKTALRDPGVLEVSPEAQPRDAE